MEQRVPYYKKLTSDATEVMSSLGLKSPDLLEGYEPVIANNGADLLIVPLKDENVARWINPHFMAIKEVCERIGVIEYYVFSPATKAQDRDAGAGYWFQTVLTLLSLIKTITGIIMCSLTQHPDRKRKIKGYEYGCSK